MRLGILCGGGPAPGMNSVISAATIEARNSGWEVVGIVDGFQHLIEGRTDAVRPLSITDVSRIHVQGGSVIRTARANPTVRDEGPADPDWRLHACLGSLRKLGIDALVTIGGDDTAFSASRLAEAAAGALHVAHVPKTIDNDLPLPGGAPTFGFETARSVGVELVNNLMTDAMTTQRWYLVVAMGRSAGHLALGIGKSAGATLTVIAEEFAHGEPIRLARLVDIVETSMLKRIAHGRPFGVAVIAEGIGLRLPEDELRQAMPEVERDEHGHVRLAELELDRLLARQVKDRFKERGQSVTVEGKNIGYELRCAPPIPFDIEYTRDLGYGAIDYLKHAVADGQPGAMITIQDGHMVPLPFGSFTDPATGRVRVRLVNPGSSSYRVGREYMIRLDSQDLEDPDRLGPIAAAAGLAPEAFRERFGYLTQTQDGRPDRRRIVVEDGKTFHLRHLGSQAKVPFEQVTSVAVVPFTADGKVVVTEQGRGPDLPGGHVKQGERSASETARRETREEAQLELGKLVLVDVIESDYLGDSPKDLTYMVTYAARVTAMQSWVPTPEASGRHVLTPEEFCARYTAGSSADMSQTVAAAYAALVDSEKGP